MSNDETKITRPTRSHLASLRQLLQHELMVGKPASLSYRAPALAVSSSNASTARRPDSSAPAGHAAGLATASTGFKCPKI